LSMSNAAQQNLEPDKRHTWFYASWSCLRACRLRLVFAEKNMKTDVESSIVFVHALNQFVIELASFGLALYETRFDALAFGSFILVVGHRKKRIKVIWEGKDSLLQLLVAKFPDSSAQPAWKNINHLTVEQAAYGVLFRRMAAEIKKVTED